MDTLNVGQAVKLTDECFDKYMSLRKHDIVYQADFGRVISVISDPENIFPTWYMVQFKKGRESFCVDLPEHLFEEVETDIGKAWDKMIGEMADEKEEPEKENEETEEAEREELDLDVDID